MMGSVARIFCVCAFAGMFSPGECGAQSLYAVQVQAFSASEAAADFSEKVQSTTAPVFTREEPLGGSGAFKVFVGPYSSYMDAWSVSKVLPDSFPSGRFIVELDEEENHKAGSGSLAAVPPVFSSLPSMQKPVVAPPDPSSFVTVTVPEALGEVSSEVSQKPVSSMSRSELLMVGLMGKKNSQSIEALERVLVQNANDPAANAVRLRLSRRLMARKEFVRVQGLLETVSQSGTTDEKAKARLIKAYADTSQLGPGAGFGIFQAMASDEGLEPELRSYSMRMAAGYAHAAREYTTAVLAFRQIEAEALSQAERDEASLQLCGLQIELVGRGKGQWPESIRACEQLAARPEISRDIKATAELMRFECLSHAGRKADALTACENYLKEYRDIRREFVSASVWYGVLLVHNGRRDEAAEALKSVLELEIGSQDKFGAHEPKARAAYWLAFLALQRDDLTTRDFYVDYIRTQLPGSLEASKLAALTPAQSPSSR